jgi:GNAT superfamily N-acetyltransferase
VSTPQTVIEVRPYRKAEDLNFVYSSWLRSYKHSSYWAKRIRHNVFFAGHQAMLNYLFAKPTFQCAVACSPEDPTQIFGYLAYEKATEGAQPIVHFVFVKDDFRKMGVARKLFEAAGITPPSLTFTHWTYTVDALVERWPDMVYSPYAI